MNKLNMIIFNWLYDIFTSKIFKEYDIPKPMREYYAAIR